MRSLLKICVLQIHYAGSSQFHLVLSTQTACEKQSILFLAKGLKREQSQEFFLLSTRSDEEITLCVIYHRPKNTHFAEDIANVYTAFHRLTCTS